MNKLKQRVWLFITIVFAICVVVYTLSYIITNPCHTLINIGGDGVKNYYTYLYHILYEKGIWFYGMNYPYGEHIVYTDAQPLLSVPLSYLHGSSCMNKENATAIMHLLIGFSYILGIIYAYKTLILFGVQRLIAVFFSSIIIIFCPQLLSLNGHYALAYANIIPMIFYWLAQYHINNRLKYPLYIFVLATLMSFLHPYFGGCAFLIVIFYVAGYAVFNHKNKNTLRHVTPLLLSMAAVYAVIKIIMGLTDPITDRPVTPHGALAYGTVGEQILTSAYSPFWRFVKEKGWYPSISSGGEGYTYIGIVAIVTVIVSLIAGFIKIRKRHFESLIVKESGFPAVYLFIAAASLLLAMGVPFVWGMEWLLDYVSVLRQFRTLGRFSWIFYYIISLYAVYAINHLYVTSLVKNSIRGYVILVCAMLVWGIEAEGYTSNMRKIASAGINNYKDFYSVDKEDWLHFLHSKQYQQNDFQAILFLPFVSIGTEKIGCGNGDEMGIAFKAALQLHLPIIDAMMSRSSWSIAEKQVRIAGGPFVSKPILNFGNNAPFLLLVPQKDVLSSGEEYLLAASDHLGNYSDCNVYACYPQRISANDKKNHNRIEALLPLLKAGDTCSAYPGSWYINHFKGGTSKEKFWGASALAYVPVQDTVIADIPIVPHGDDRRYEFSIWVLLYRKDYRTPIFYLELYDDSGNFTDRVQMRTEQVFDNVGLWFRFAKDFTIPANCRHIKCRVKSDNTPSYRALDELMLRPTDATVISKEAGGAVMVNNHLLN